MSEAGFLPVKPAGRPPGARPLARWRAARRNLFGAMKDSLYGAKMAVVRTPLRDAFLVNQPDLAREVLARRPGDFPKARALTRPLSDLMGRGVFCAEGEDWARQRRMLAGCFDSGLARRADPAIRAAADTAVRRLAGGGEVEIEAATSRFAADVIFRLLFSRPVAAAEAAALYGALRRFQSAAPLVSAPELLNLPRLWPRRGRAAGRAVRAILRPHLERRARAVAAGAAPDDMATRMLSARDPETGVAFTLSEALDQAATICLAGHETSAGALAWALYLLAHDSASQNRVRAEAARGPSEAGFTHDVIREALRLYPPVPLLARNCAGRETFRGVDVAPGSLILISPWHLHRHRDHWRDPDRFDPCRWADRAAARGPWLPFGAGPRACPGAGLAMAECAAFLRRIVLAFELAPGAQGAPKPTTQLTLRSETGVWLRLGDL